MHTLRIITPDSGGLLNDATVYKNLFKHHGFQVSIIKYTYAKKIKSVQNFSEINLFLENINWKNLVDIFPCKINLFMPNYELFYEATQLAPIQFILCKTQITFDMFESIKKEYQYKYQCIYTKFTTFIPHNLRTPINKHIDKDINLFTHLAGKSPMKNTADLVYCWIINKGFLNIDPNIKLIITCYKKCYDKMIEILKDRYGFAFDSIRNEVSDKTNVILYSNMEFHLSIVPETDYIKLLTRANVAICPSEREGYGHYINEARYFGTFVVTIDHPPMNEMIDNQNGTLITKYSSTSKDTPGISFATYKVYPDIKNFADKIKHCINKKNELGNNQLIYRKRYFSDMKFFDEKMTEFIKKLT